MRIATVLTVAFLGVTCLADDLGNLGANRTLVLMNGVVDIITKRNFTGFEGDADASVTGHGDRPTGYMHPDRGTDLGRLHHQH